MLENLNHHSRVLTSLTHHYLNNKNEYKNLNLIRQDQYSKNKEVRDTEETQSKISLLKYAKHCHKSNNNDYNQDLTSDFFQKGSIKYQEKEDDERMTKKVKYVNGFHTR